MQCSEETAKRRIEMQTAVCLSYGSQCHGVSEDRGVRIRRLLHPSLLPVASDDSLLR